MERQLHELQGEPECGTDRVLVQLVYAQRINEIIAQVHDSHQLVDVRPSSSWTANLDKLLADIDNLRRSDCQQKPHRC